MGSTVICDLFTPKEVSAKHSTVEISAKLHPEMDSLLVASNMSHSKMSKRGFLKDTISSFTSRALATNTLEDD